MTIEKLQKLAKEGLITQVALVDAIINDGVLYVNGEAVDLESVDEEYLLKNHIVTNLGVLEMDLGEDTNEDAGDDVTDTVPGEQDPTEGPVEEEEHKEELEPEASTESPAAEPVAEVAAEPAEVAEVKKTTRKKTTDEVEPVA